MYSPLLQANLQLVVNIAKEYTEQLGADKIVALLEAHNSWPGLYLYLGSRIAFRCGWRPLCVCVCERDSVEGGREVDSP